LYLYTADKYHSFNYEFLSIKKYRLENYVYFKDTVMELHSRAGEEPVYWYSLDPCLGGKDPYVTLSY